MGYDPKAETAAGPRVEGRATRHARTPGTGVRSGYRYYSPGLGRWLNRDPIGEAGGINQYGFAGNKSLSRIDLLGMKCVAVSEPRITGSDWELSRVVLDGIPASFSYQIDGVDVTWRLEGEVECCCKFLFFFRRRVTRTIHKTITRAAQIPRKSLPIFALAPGNLPVNVPSPKSIAEGIGEILGEIVGDIVGGGYFVTEDEHAAIGGGILRSKPKSLREGDWPEDPCN